MASLADLTPGQKGKIIKLSEDPNVRFKLISLGLLPGDTLAVITCAPFGGPQVIGHGDQLQFAIRKDVSRHIEVELCKA